MSGQRQSVRIHRGMQPNVSFKPVRACTVQYLHYTVGVFFTALQTHFSLGAGKLTKKFTRHSRCFRTKRLSVSVFHFHFRASKDGYLKDCLAFETFNTEGKPITNNT